MRFFRPYHFRESSFAGTYHEAWCRLDFLHVQFHMDGQCVFFRVIESGVVISPNRIRKHTDVFSFSECRRVGKAAWKVFPNSIQGFVSSIRGVSRTKQRRSTLGMLYMQPRYARLPMVYPHDRYFNIPAGKTGTQFR